MRPGRRPALATAAALLLAALLAAAAPAHAEGLLQVLARAQRDNPALRAARAAYAAARTRVPAARAALLPQLEADASLGMATQHNGGNPLLQNFRLPTDWRYESRDLSLTATQALWQPGARLRVHVAEDDAQLAYVALLRANQQLMIDVAAAYFERLAAQDALDALQGQLDAVARQLASARQQFAAGNGTIVDVRDAQARDDLLLAQRIAARNRIALADDRLLQLSGARCTDPARLSALPRLPGPAGTLEQWAARARREALAVRAAQLRRDAARLQQRIAASATQPVVDAYARVEHAGTSGGSNLFPFGNRSDVGSVGVQLRWPLLTGGRAQADVDQTAQQLAQTDDLLAAARDDAGHAARSAYLQLDADRARVTALRAALHSSAAALDANRLGFQVGMRASVDVLDALAQRYEARRELDAARYAVLLDGLRLREAAGTLRTADVREVDALLRR